MIHIQRPLPFILASTNIGTMIVNHLDKCETPNGAYGVGYQFLQTGSFDFYEVESVVALLNLRRQYFGDGVVALDCGANIGAHSVTWGIAMTHFGRVIAFEAQERIYYALAGNIAINNGSKFIVFLFSLMNLDKSLGGGGFLDIPQVDYTKPASFGSLELKANINNEFIGQNIDYQKTQKVPLISIDSLELERVDFVKIDVERMEVEVLNGAMKTLKKYKPILLIEVLKSPQQEIFDLIKPLGYEIFPMGMNILAVFKDDPVLKHINQK